MPLYEYECEACERRFEKIQKFSDPPEETCPTCGGRVRKLIASPAFHLKGSGWYITDYAKKDDGGKKDDGAPKSEATEKPTGGSDKDAGAKKDGAKTEAAATPSSTESTSSGTSAPAKPPNKD